MNLPLILEKRSRLFWIIIGLALIFGVGTFDFLTGLELAVSLFYLIPISLVAWFSGRALGVAASILSAIIWLFADIAAGKSYSHFGIYIWNMFIPFGFFLIVTLLLTALKRSLKHERELSRTDYLTGAANARFFSYLLQDEIERCRRYRHPFVVAYVDVDDFKRVNDEFGHSVGNEVLRSIVSIIRQNLRKTDVIARMGGDEFAVLLLETGRDQALSVITAIQKKLLDAMHHKSWPVTLSIGALICIDAPETVDAVIKIADGLMYSIKMNGKNGVNCSFYPS